MAWWSGAGESSGNNHLLRDRLRTYAVASAGDDDISQFPAVASQSVSQSPIGLMAVYAALVGAVVGAAVAGVAHLILFIERTLYGADHRHIIAPIEKTGATNTLLLSFLAVGIITGIIWTVMHLKVKKPVSIPQAMRGSDMPVVATTVSALTQVASVSAGLPIGRENAPRQLGSLLASLFSHFWMVDKRTRRLLVACAAGAGMSASFHLPLAGAIFTLELLLISATVRAVVTAMTCSVTATIVSGLLGTPRIHYVAVTLNESALTLLCAVIVGAVAGIAGDYFARLVQWASSHRVAPKWQWLTITGVMALVALASKFYLGASGNGAYVANEALTARVTISVALAVIILRVALAFVTFWAGADGGILTPSFSLGAMVGLACGDILQYAFPAVDPRGCALLGAAAFLSTTMAAPLFGMIAAVEFTNQGGDGYLAMFTAVVVAALAVRAFEKEHGSLLLRTVWPNRSFHMFQGHSPFADDARPTHNARPSSSVQNANTPTSQAGSEHDEIRKVVSERRAQRRDAITHKLTQDKQKGDPAAASSASGSSLPDGTPETHQHTTGSGTDADESGHSAGDQTGPAERRKEN